MSQYGIVNTSIGMQESKHMEPDDVDVLGGAGRFKLPFSKIKSKRDTSKKLKGTE